MERSSSEKNTIFFTAGIAALVAASGVCFALARAISPAFSPVKLDSLSWVAHVEFGIERSNLTSSVEKKSSDDVSSIQRKLAKLYLHKYPTPKIRRVIASARHSLKPEIDRLQMTVAHPETPREATSAELRRIQELHRNIFAQFRASLI